MCRHRFEGGPEELACALAPHMEFAGALRYLDQEPGMSQPTVDKLKLQRQPLRGALQALHELASNLSFTKSCMSEALAMVAEKKKINLDVRDYQQRTTARLRLACRHASQAMCKKPRAVWVKEMFGDLNTASPAEEYVEQDELDEQDPFDSATAGKSSSTVFVYEVDAGTKSVTRKVVGSRKHATETTFDVFTEGNDETLSAWARWSTEPPVQLPSEVLTVLSPKKGANLGVTHDHG